MRGPKLKTLVVSMLNSFQKILFILAIGVLISCGTQENSADFQKTIKFQNPKAGEIRYKYIPFEVPEKTKSLSLAYEYDKNDGKNRIEFGVFGPSFSGENTDKRGLRGWSGSVRGSVFIAKDSATHGYSSGEIETGKWYIILGLASVADEGVDITLKVKFNEIDEKAKRQFEDENKREFEFEKKEKFERVKSNGLTWFAGDLHAHTFHGDGRWSVKGILESATSNNLDFVALTEHNTFSHHRAIEKVSKDYPNLLVLKGQEITTYGGHINAWGLPMGEWIDFRVPPNREESARRIAAEAKKLGAIVSVNHPTMDCGGCGWTYGDWDNMTSVEVWNATWDAQDESALKQWDALLRQGKRITAIGSSDSHQRPEEPSDYPTNLAIGEPSVFIGAEAKTKKNLLQAIKNGRVFVAENSQRSIVFRSNNTVGIGDTIELKKVAKISFNFTVKGFPRGSRVNFISGDGILFEKETVSDVFNDSFLAEAAKDSYFRLEIRNEKGKMLAFTNPIYIRVK